MKEISGEQIVVATAERTDFWAVATPLLAAFSRPTPSASGVATAQVASRLPRSVAGELQQRAQRTLNH